MIYEMWIIKNSPVGEQVYDQMTGAEKQEFSQKLMEAHNAVGATVWTMCDSGWANEEYQNWGITSFPSLEARTAMYDKMQQGGLFRVIESAALLGTTDQQPALPTFPNPVYLLWVLRNEPGSILARKQLMPDQMSRLRESEQATFARNGGSRVITCDCYWADEAYAAFGVEAFPSLEALQAYKDDLYQLDWYVYFPGETVLGLPATMP